MAGRAQDRDRKNRRIFDFDHQSLFEYAASEAGCGQSAGAYYCADARTGDADQEGCRRSEPLHPGLRTVVLYGGMDYNKQQRDLEEGPVDIVVATPGRLLDFESKNVCRLRFVGNHGDRRSRPGCLIWALFLTSAASSLKRRRRKNARPCCSAPR